MGYPIDLALRYMGSKKRAFISLGTAFAIVGVSLGVAALAIVMSVTGGFQKEFRDKVLGVNAHVLVLKYSTDFREYRTIMDQVAKVPGVVGVAPFSINPMMLTHGDATATGVLLKGVDPQLSLGVDAKPGTVPVLDMPKHVIEGDLHGLRVPGAKPPERTYTAPPLFDEPGAPPTDADGGTGDWERDDAGRPVELLRRIAEAKLPDGASEKDAQARDAGVTDAGADDKIDDKAPRGDVVPQGGYKSVLPDDDVIPPDVDPDPCADPHAVSKMPGIVVGVTLAKTLNLKLGDCVTVTSPTIGFSYAGGQIKPPVAKRFRVIAVFEHGFDQYDSKLVYTDLYEAQAFYDQGDTVTGVEMKVDDVDKAGDIAKQISDLLASGLYHTMDWEELNHGLFTALRIQQILMSSVLALIIVVAAFTVIATLIMVVLDKKKEIAVLKAMGATDGGILRTFLYQGAIIGLVGTAAGLLLGLFFCKVLLIYGYPLDPKVYFISRLPVLVRPQEFLITGECALAICLDATILPSLYAANLDPAEGFRDQIEAAAGPRRMSGWLTAWLYYCHVSLVLDVVLAAVLLETGSTLPGLSRNGNWFVLVFAGACAVCVVAILLWKRWGVYVGAGLFAIWFALTTFGGVMMATGRVQVGPGPLVGWAMLALVALSTVLFGLTLLALRKHWRYLR
ncbi:MAG TPA: ABC transporter permease [Minicystis sp.]|nr:ABC transporter permease [Minicystis sp.]